MKYIQKQNPPEEFVTYCCGKGASFDDLGKNHNDIKQKLKNSLLEEQGYICCYCGKRIENGPKTTIEHIKPKGLPEYKHLELEYKNLLCSCNGGQSERQTDRYYPLHCDAFKKDKVLPIDPLDVDCGDYFKFDDEGNIFGCSDDAKKVIKALNLDKPLLNTWRKHVIDAYKLFDSDTNWEEEYERLNKRDIKNHYDEFSFVIQSYIREYML